MQVHSHCLACVQFSVSKSHNLIGGSVSAFIGFHDFSNAQFFFKLQGIFQNMSNLFLF